MDKCAKLLADPTVNNQTIPLDNVIVGSVAKFMVQGDAEITFWIDRAFWGRGIATQAPRMFLAIDPNRPLFGRVAFDNYGPQRVLQKCGFEQTGTDIGFQTKPK